MISVYKKYFLKSYTSLKSFLSSQKEDTTPHLHSKSIKNLSPKKQAELNVLCQQLFKKKENLTSGKFQFIGLNKIKKKIGKGWEGLSKIVYEITENVLNENIEKNDIFIRYHDDTYIIIFADASPKDTQAKAQFIAKEIMKRLFERNEEELKSIEIQQAISEISTDALMNAGDIGSMFDTIENDFGDLDYGAPNNFKTDSISLDSIAKTEVGTEYRINKKLLEETHTQPPCLDYYYKPLWDTKRRALTTYLCLSKEKESANNSFECYQNIYKNRSLSEQLSLDILILNNVTKELQNMEQDGRKFFIICPVQHDVVYNMESYEEYKKVISKIPPSQRQFLILLITGLKNVELLKNPYWFAQPLRVFCPYVFAETPLRRDINFSYLRNSGVNVAGVRLNKEKMTEQQTLTLLNNFCAKAKALSIPQTFALNVSSLSLTTSAVCSGFDFLGGSAIHGPVKKPDHIHRYHHADLIKELVE